MGDRQVGILHAPDADHPRDVGPLLLGELGARLVDVGAGVLHGLVEEVHEAQGGAGPGLEDLAVLAEDRADLDVLDLHLGGVLRQVARLPRGLVDHLQVQALGHAHDIQDPVGVQVLDAVLDRRQVGGAVAVAAVGLADEQRDGLVLAAGEAGEEDDERAVVHGRDALGLEVGADAGEVLVVRRLTGQVVVGEGHAEGGVDLVEVDLGQVVELAPEPQRLGVAGLQPDDPGTGARREVLGPVELRAGCLVERVGVGLDDVRLRGVLADLEEVLDQHPEGGAPVADVVLPDDGVAEVLEGAGERVADDRRAQVADVHLLGDVGRGVVDRDDLGRLGGHAEPRVRLGGLHLLGDPRVAEGHVDEARSADLGGRDEVARLEVLHDGVGDVARLATEPLGQGHGGVDLHVGELAGSHHRVRPSHVLAERGDEGGLHGRGEGVDRGNHGSQVSGPHQPGRTRITPLGARRPGGRRQSGSPPRSARPRGGRGPPAQSRTQPEVAPWTPSPASPS